MVMIFASGPDLQSEFRAGHFRLLFGCWRRTADYSNRMLHGLVSRCSFGTSSSGAPLTRLENRGSASKMPRRLMIALARDANLLFDRW